MEELSSVHRYAAGALLAIALNQAQIHRQQLVPEIQSASDNPKFWISLEDEGIVPWSSQDYGLLHHVFGYLGIDPHAWPGIEKTAVSPDAKHHIGPFIRILAEENGDVTAASSSDHGSSQANKMDKTVASLAKAVDDMAVNLEEYAASRSQPASERYDEELSSDDTSSVKEKQMKTKAALLSAQRWALMKRPILERASSSSGASQRKKPDDSSVKISSNLDYVDKEEAERRTLVAQRKVAVLYELLTACVADTPEEKAGKSVLSAGYDARQRVALRLLALWLDVDWKKMIDGKQPKPYDIIGRSAYGQAAMELMVAYVAMEAEKEREKEKAANHAAEDEANKSKWQRWKRGGIIGAAAVTGGALLALTGGLAAPAIAAGLSAIGTVVPLGIGGLATVVGSAAGSVAVAASFGAAGAGLAGTKMARRTGGVDEFMFIPIGDNHQQGRLAVGIVISGIVMDTVDYTIPWEGDDGDLERYALRWESKELIPLTTAIEDWLASSAARELVKAGAMMTVLAGLITALAWPVALLSAADWIDGRWTIAVDRADKAGKILAKCLLSGSQGNRPVTLIGFSLGARVIFSCLEYLAKKGNNASIVERVVLLGAPLTLDQEKWSTVRKVVAGRFVNAYSSNDWILGIVYRSSFMTTGLAGIQKVDTPGIENIDVTDIIDGHSMYLAKTREILEAIDLNSFYPIYPSKLQSSLDRAESSSRKS